MSQMRPKLDIYILRDMVQIKRGRKSIELMPLDEADELGRDLCLAVAAARATRPVPAGRGPRLAPMEEAAGRGPRFASLEEAAGRGARLAVREEAAGRSLRSASLEDAAGVGPRFAVREEAAAGAPIRDPTP